MTVPNQRTIIIHRNYPKTNFLQISNEHWMRFNKKHGPFALQVYLYLAKNKDGYSFALSQEAAERDAGICKTSFHKYIKLLIDKGYLVRRNGNTYDFYETPYGQEEKETEGSPCDELSNSQDKQKNLPHKQTSLFREAKPPHSDKQINKTYNTHNNIHKGNDNQQQQEGRNQYRKKERTGYDF